MLVKVGGVELEGIQKLATATLRMNEVGNIGSEVVGIFLTKSGAVF
jgi:hypothetical protein